MSDLRKKYILSNMEIVTTGLDRTDSIKDRFPISRPWGEILYRPDEPLNKDQVVVTPPRQTHVVPDELSPLIDNVWTRASAQNPHIFNGPLISLEGLENRDGLLVIHTGRTDYKTLLGTNMQPDIAARYPAYSLSNGLASCSIVTTSDGFVILGLRPSQKLGVIGGTVDRPDVFTHISSELEEELGLSSDDLSRTDTRLLAVTRNGYTKRPLNVFVSHTQLTKPHMEERFMEQGNKQEHSALAFFANSQTDITHLISTLQTPDPVTRANVDALAVYSEYAFP